MFKTMLLMQATGLLLALPSLAAPDGSLRAEAAGLAERDGVPVEPLLQKIREGEAKGVAPQRVGVAVRQLHARLVQGRVVCGPKGVALCVAAAADAVGQGADPAALAALIDEAPVEDHARALVGVTLLGARGVSSSDAIAQVAQALHEKRLEALLAVDPGPLLPSTRPEAVGAKADLPVGNPARDRDQTGNGKAWGKDKPAAGGRPVEPPAKGKGEGRPD